MPYLADPDVTLYHGDAREVLRELPDESVHCIATSPPFYALRNYGVDGQIGLESTPEEWAQRLVEVFREARRVLRRDGTLWVECGDSYASVPKGNPGALSVGLTNMGRNAAEANSHRTRLTVTPGFKPKDLLGTPWLLAFVLRADGWWLRGCNIWAKPNAMPESAKDRCTTAHSYVFHLSKSARYFFDGDAISEPAAWERWGDQTVPKHEGTSTAAGWIKPKGKNELLAEHGGGIQDGARTRAGFNARWDEREANGTLPSAKHPRSVWTIPTQGFPEAHFATWPEALARKIILAAVPERVGHCPECGLEYVNGVRASMDRSVRGVRGDVLGGETETSAVLLDDVREPLSREALSEADADDEGLHCTASPGSPASIEAGLRHGASDRDGNPPGTLARTDRGRPPQERRQGRQQAGESGGHAEASSRSEGQASAEADAVSALRRDARGQRSARSNCERCGTELVEQPGVVLDCFAGSGTTLYVARKLGRRGIGIDLNESYLEMAARRLAQQSLFAEAM